MDTTAETLVGTDYNNETLLVFILEGFGFRFFEDCIGCFAVAAGLGHGALSPGKLGGGNDLHGFGDLLDVLDGFEPLLDFAKSGIVGGLGSHGSVSGFIVSYS